MIEALIRDDAFLQDVERAREAQGTYHIWWLGQSGFLLKWRNRHLLIDPYLSDSLADKYRNDPARPHTRMTEIVVEPIRLDFIDVCLITHAHGDHMDPATLRDIWTVSPAMRMIMPEAIRKPAADELRIHPELPIGIDDGETVEYGDFQITGIAAAHEELETDDEGRHKYLGYVIEFDEGFTVYHSGDTVRYDGLVEQLKPYDIDVALLPINGRKPERGVAGNFSGAEAAQFAREIGAHLAIPCHYDMFAFNTASPQEFTTEAEIVEQPVRVLQVGERWSNVE